MHICFKLFSLLRRPIVLGIVSLLISSTAFAGQLYRYKNEAGNTVLNRTIPPALVKNGYDILNEKGRLIQRVPPALTPEQIAERDAELEKKKAIEAERERQRQADYELIQLYGHPNDAVRILKRKTNDIKGVILVKKGQIDTTQRQVIAQETKAANLQRNGRAIPESILKKIKTLKNDVENSNAEIVELEKELNKVLSEFDKKIKRLETITNKQATDYPAFLQSFEESKSGVSSNQASNAETKPDETKTKANEPPANL